MKFVESNIVELKEKFTPTMLKTISAYSNFHNGYIYIGVNDVGKVVGIENIVKEKSKIENIINTSITPIPFFEINILEIENKKILEIQVFKGDNGPYYYKNTAYMRNDTSTIPLDGPNLTRLVLSSKNLTFDQVKVHQTNLSFNYLKNRMKANLGLNNFNQDTLITFGLLKENAYNQAALLLADNGTLNQSYVDIARFKLDTNTFLNRKKLEHGSILEYFDQAIKIFQEQYPPYQVIDGVHRITKEHIPLVAFRESLSNAIIHRDYLLSSGIQISMFDNYIEIISPGGLPKGMDEEQFLHGRVSLTRNPIIANVFFRLNLIEHFGTGIRRIIESYQTSKFKPYFDIQMARIKIILPVISFDYSKLEEKQAIISFLSANPKSSRQRIEEVLRLEKSTLIRRLNKLEQEGIITKIGSGPSTVYGLL